MTVSTRRVLATGLRVFSAIVLIGLLMLLVTHVQWSQVGAALAHASVPLIVAAAALNFVNLACKTARWQTMLAPLVGPALRGTIGYVRLYYYLVISYAASAVLPARAGEALRVYLLRRRDQIPVADSIGVIVVEKLFEVLGLLTVVAPLPLLMALPHWAELSIWVIIGGGLSALLFAVLLAGWTRSDGEPSRWDGLARGLACMRDPSRVVRSVGWSIAAYLTDAMEIWLVLRALGIDVPWATPALVLLGANLAIAIPSTPGQLGALEAGVVAGLAIVGVPTAPALAFALVYHIMQLLPIVIIGMSGIRLMSEAKQSGLADPVEATP